MAALQAGMISQGGGRNRPRFFLCLPQMKRGGFHPPTRVDPRGLSGFLVLWVFFVLIPIAGLVLWSFLAMKDFQLVWEPTFQAYRDVLGSGRWVVVVRTLRLAAIVTLIEIFFAVPFTLWLAKGVRSTFVKVAVLSALTIPFFLSLSARTIVWRAVLGLNGPINLALVSLGITDAPLDWLLFSEFAVTLGLIGPYFPTMVFPLYLAINLIDDEVLAASKDLGASPAFTFWHVVIPLAIPGLGAGLIFTFIPMIGDPVVPSLLGGGHVIVLSASIQSLLQILNYTVAAALSVFMLAIMVGLILAFARIFSRSMRGRTIRSGNTT